MIAYVPHVKLETVCRSEKKDKNFLLDGGSYNGIVKPYNAKNHVGENTVAVLGF